MRRALVTALLLASATVSAEDEDPKQAIRDRGIVLKASKRSYVVIVPATTPAPKGTPADSKLREATIYFGDAKTLFRMQNAHAKYDSDDKESIDLRDHPRNLSSGTLRRNGETYELACDDQFDIDNRKTFPLVAVDNATTSLAKATIRPMNFLFGATVLARVPGGTTYLYVDRNLTKGAKEYRLFLGKQGAMKPIAVKESALDSVALVIVTAKGTLTATQDGKGDFASATWGNAKNPTPLTLIPTASNRSLIYRDLGVYTKVRTGHPCYEL